MKIKYIYLIALFISGSLLTLTAFRGAEKPAERINTPRKTIKFNHKLHKDNVECASCHSGIAGSTSLSSGLFPKHEDCASCHDVADKNNCGFCHFENSFEKLANLNTNLNFSHKKHLEKEKDCLKCHAGIDSDENKIAEVKFAPAMEKCYTCHGLTNTATAACEACHKATANLIPKDHRSNNFAKLHKFAAEAPNANCTMCHENSTCEDCHNANQGITSANTKNDFYMPYAATQSTSALKLQRVNRVHEVGFRFTHGMASKGKDAECSTCHQTETFCAECHSADKKDFAMGGIMPVSHTKPGFALIGVGSGGGEHAVLARRDIEQCAACHDAQGGDPVCITCHVDNDGVKGTNPKTHKSGFLKDSDEGDWHSSRGSVCYTCHTDANAHPGGIAGIGFCGYCHGTK